MIFNSIEYILFLPIVFLLYWFVFDYALANNKHQLRLQNLFVVVASYVFYGWWNWRFLLLIALTSFLSYGSGLLIAATQEPASKRWITANVVLNLLILGVFKYFHFFVDSFCTVFHLQSSVALHVILPVGISFYTFQALSYSIDVYRKKIAPTRDIVAFFAYISFFPQLVAGPIERATNLLPQFTEKRVFNYPEAVDGLRRILWGMFKKVVIADTLARHVNMVYGNLSDFEGSTILASTIFFAIQIYCDFSGYSDIAIGTARLFGIRLRDNFICPYFSRNVAEFWKRWHVSLNTWFVDYVYIPLGGDGRQLAGMNEDVRGKNHRLRITLRNTFIIFLLSGLWHGANWTFVLWGLYHALLFVPLILLGRTKKYTLSHTPTIKDAGAMLCTFAFVTLGWVLFRAEDLSQVVLCFQKIFSAGLFTMPHLIDKEWYVSAFISICLLVVVEWFSREEGGYPAFRLHPSKKVFRYAFYVLLCVLIVGVCYFGIAETSNKFIYFQF